MSKVLFNGVELNGTQELPELTYAQYEAIPEGAKPKYWIMTDDALSGDSVSVTADGVKTYATLLNELYALVDHNKFGRNSVLVVAVPNSNTVYARINRNTLSNRLIFSSTIIGYSNNDVLDYYFILDGSGSKYRERFNGSVTDESSTVPTNGTKITLYYNTSTLGQINTKAENCVYGNTNVKDALDTAAYKNVSNTFSESQIIDEADGTTAIVGSSFLTLGNNKAEGVDKNSKGFLKIFGKGIYRAHLMATNMTGNRDIELPDKNGTIALTSDLPSDSGWILGTPVNGNYMMYRKIGNVVYVARHTVGTISADTSTVVGNLPAGYRPLVAVFNGSGTQYIEIKASGEISIKSPIANYMPPWYVSFIADA